MPDVLRPSHVDPVGLSELAAVAGAPTPTVPVEVTGITHHSRQVRPGDLYAALPGAHAHGCAYVAEARDRGAVAVLTDPVGAADRVGDLPTLVVAYPRRVLGPVAARVYGDPSRDLLVVGVTGTNGKTTTAYFVEAGLRRAGHRTGLIGTVETRVGEQVLPSARTTPEAPDLQAALAVMRERGVTGVAMEVSSHALALYRVDGVYVDVAVFTNLSQDHLDFHGDMESYFAAKARLFTPELSARGVVCVDDEYGIRMVALASVPVTTVATGEREADWRVVAVETGRWGSATVTLEGPAGRHLGASCRVPGEVNLANTAVAAVALDAAGVPGSAVARGSGVTVPGRMERATSATEFAAFVDYAHTPDAVRHAIETVRPWTSGRVLVVLGCGGDRDRAKRPLMGEVAARLADVVIVTDDNPRSELPEAIRAAVVAGTQRVPQDARAEVLEIADRRMAIDTAVGLARPDDTLLVLGKGHEQGQEVRGEVLPFDDRIVLDDAINKKAL